MGLGSLSLTLAGSNASNEEVYQNVLVNNGQSYTVSVWVNQQTATASPNGNWQQLSVTYTGTATGRMGIHLKVPLVTGTTYTAFFDDVQIVPGPPPAGLTPTLSLNYAYDGFGNLTSKGATNEQYSTSLIVEGKTNRVVSAGGVTFSYTANGSAQPSGTSVDTFTYDTLNRLMRTNSVGSQYFGYGYLPGINTRLLYGKVFAGTMFPSLDFYGPDGKLLANYRISQGVTPTEMARYLYLEGKPLNWPEDRLGSAGNYMPYGDYPSTSQDPGVYGTYLADAGTGAGGFFAKQRYYNSNWGRFMTVDPLRSSAKVGTPQSWNRYGYVLGDPVNGSDPSGLDDIVCPPLTCVTVSGAADPLPYYFSSFSAPVRQSTKWSVGDANDLHPGRDDSDVSKDSQAKPKGGVDSLKDTLCKAIPSGRTIGVSAGLGGIGSVGGGGEVVVNYNSGQVSAFVFWGVQVGWNGGASGSVFSGFVYGLKDSNSNYSGGFTGANLGAGLGVFAASSSSGVVGDTTRLALNGDVQVGGISFGAGLAGGPSGGASLANYSTPLQAGQYWLFGPIDALLWATRQGCK